MIHVDKDFANIPEGLVNRSAIKKRLALLKQGNQHKFDSRCYRHESVIAALNTIYHNKCAYCEGQINDGFTLHVEHYRPKKGVKNDPQHSGYYWLAYEWSNLLLACQACNSKKSNHFPIAGARVKHRQTDRSFWIADSDSFRQEEALLLNPELDQPQQHFSYQADGCLIANTNRAKKTEDICDLNRESLRLARKKLLDEAATRLRQQAKEFLKKKNEPAISNDYNGALELCFKTFIIELKNTAQPEHPYSAFSAYLFEHFQAFICNTSEEIIITNYLRKSVPQEIAEKMAKDLSKILLDAYRQFAY